MNDTEQDLIDTTNFIEIIKTKAKFFKNRKILLNISYVIISAILFLLYTSEIFNLKDMAICFFVLLAISYIFYVKDKKQTLLNNIRLSLMLAAKESILEQQPEQVNNKDNKSNLFKDFKKNLRT